MIKSLLRLLAGVLVLGLAACSTIDSRIGEKADVFARLDPATQARIRQGIIGLGFTRDMAYIALGKPDEIHDRVNTAGRTTVWTYNSYYERYEGTLHAGYHRFATWDPRTRGYRYQYEPVYADVYSEQQETNIRVFFQNDKVTAIEQMKR